MKRLSSPKARTLFSMLACAAIVLIATIVCAQEKTAPPSVAPAQILEGLRQRYSGMSFEAAFFQESHLKAVGTVDTAEGRVYIKPPAMMRWHYKTPDEYLIITDGNTVWIHYPADNQVMVGLASEYFGGASEMDFLTNPARLLDDFDVELSSDRTQDETVYALRLTPKVKRPTLAELLLFVSKKTSQIVQSVSFTPQGDKTILSFYDVRFVAGLDDSLFKFEIPKNAEVIPME